MLNSVSELTSVITSLMENAEQGCCSFDHENGTGVRCEQVICLSFKMSRTIKSDKAKMRPQHYIIFPQGVGRTCSDSWAEKVKTSPHLISNL